MPRCGVKITMAGRSARVRIRTPIPVKKFEFPKQLVICPAVNTPKKQRDNLEARRRYTAKGPDDEAEPEALAPQARTRDVRVACPGSDWACAEACAAVIPIMSCGGALNQLPDDVRESVAMRATGDAQREFGLMHVEWTQAAESALCNVWDIRGEASYKHCGRGRGSQ